MMFSSGLLILSLPPRYLLSRLKNILSEASQKINKTLYVKVDHRQNLIKSPSRIDSSNLRHLVPQIYSQAARYCSHLDVRVLQTFSGKFYDHHLAGRFQIVLSDTSLNLNMYLKHQFNMDASGLALHSSTDSNDLQDVSAESAQEKPLESFDYVVLGGTFDRLHNGHKILLCEGINLCNKELVIGVTDGIMTKNKMLYELMEPVNLRMSALTEFLQDANPKLSYTLEPIYDPFGPAIRMSKLECIVVSQETLKGGHMVNQKRHESGMNQLEIREVSLLEDSERESDVEDLKISSSSLRRRCLGTLLREPKLKQILPDLPYLIGLTGGIASGKSSIGRRLQDLGAGLINCDQLAHLSYVPGTPTYSSIVEEFGTEILAKDKTIDRKLLANAAFGNEAKRQKLNNLVWPAVKNLAQSRVKFLHESGHKVIVLEAALLLEAGWDESVHQVWVATVPEKEAVKRVVARDGSTEDAALKRIQSQMCNVDRIAHADIAFSTLWEPEETQKQVEKAWSALKKYLHQKNICRL